MPAASFSFETARALAGIPYLIIGEREVTPLPLTLAGFSGYRLLPGARTNPASRALSVIDYIVLLVGVSGSASQRDLKQYTVGMSSVSSRMYNSSVQAKNSRSMTRYFTQLSRGVYGLTQLGRARFMELTNSES